MESRFKMRSRRNSNVSVTGLGTIWKMDSHSAVVASSMVCTNRLTLTRSMNIAITRSSSPSVWQRAWKSRISRNQRGQY